MGNKEITIETNYRKKGKLDHRTLTCQVYDSGNKRIYVLNQTNRNLMRYHFLITPGCRIIDDGVTYSIQDIWYPPAPKYPHLIVFPNKTV